MGPIWGPTWGPLGAAWGLFRSFWRVPFSKSLSTPLRDPFRKPFGSPKRSISSPLRGLKPGPARQCIFIRNVQRPIGFCTFSPSRPAPDILQTGLFEAFPSDLQWKTGARPSGGRFGAQLGAPRGPQIGPKPASIGLGCSIVFGILSWRWFVGAFGGGKANEARAWGRPGGMRRAPGNLQGRVQEQIRSGRSSGQASRARSGVI